MTRDEYKNNAEVRKAYNRAKYKRLSQSAEWKAERKKKQKESYNNAKNKGLCVICRNSLATKKTQCERCKNRTVKRVKAWLQKLRLEVYIAYGGAFCACCGESKMDFLSLDHVDGGGTRLRKEEGQGGANEYCRLKRRGFPNGFQVLCFNCNWGRHRNGGICPHKIVKS